MTMIDNVNLFNEIYFEENPLLVFESPESPYHDYHSRVTETDSYYSSMVRVSSNKMRKWNMTSDQSLGNLLMAYYTSYFELFAGDGLVKTFYNTFPRYCEEVLLDNQGFVFKDILGDTFLHYVSYSFDCVEAMTELFNEAHSRNNKVLNPLLSLKNSLGLTPHDIILLE